MAEWTLVGRESELGDFEVSTERRREALGEFLGARPRVDATQSRVL
ncbi:MAG: hypothetical protein WCB63_14225 [Polyangiales bacterium]